MKQYIIKFFLTFNVKDGITEHTTIEKKYKARDIDHLKVKINKFLNKLYSFKDMNYDCDNYDVREMI